jgi:hypothetical protein
MAFSLFFSVDWNLNSWTQGLMIAQQVHDHLSHAPSGPSFLYVYWESFVVKEKEWKRSHYNKPLFWKLEMQSPCVKDLLTCGSLENTNPGQGVSGLNWKLGLLGRWLPVSLMLKLKRCLMRSMVAVGTWPLQSFIRFIIDSPMSKKRLRAGKWLKW